VDALQEKRGKMTAFKGLCPLIRRRKGDDVFPMNLSLLGITKIRQKNGLHPPSWKRRTATEALKKDFTF